MARRLHGVEERLRGPRRRLRRPAYGQARLGPDREGSARHDRDRQAPRRRARHGRDGHAV